MTRQGSAESEFDHLYGAQARNAIDGRQEVEAHGIGAADGDVRYVPGVDRGFSALAHESRYAWASRNFGNGVKTVLDFGCGSGYGTSALARALPNAAVVGVDYSPTAIDYATETFGDNRVRFVSLDATGNDVMSQLQRQQFDLVTSFDVIEHIEKYDRYMSNLTSLVAPGGTALIGCPNRLQTFSWNRQWNVHHVQEFTPYQLERLLRTYFEDVRLVAQSVSDPIVRMALQRQALGGSALRRVVSESLTPNVKARLRRIAPRASVARPTPRSQSESEVTEIISFITDASGDRLNDAFGLVSICRGARLGPN